MDAMTSDRFGGHVLRAGWCTVFLGALLGGLLAAGCNGSSDEGAGADPQPSHSGGYAEREPIDPVELNGPIFEGWSVPDAALVISGEMLGYIEPCGCAGLENQKGGLRRRHTLLKQLADEGWPLAAIDVGGHIRRFGPQAGIKLDTILLALQTMDYSAVALGPTDLQLPPDRLLSALIDDANPFVAANISFNPESDVFAGLDFAPPTRILQAGNRRIGVTAILGEQYQAKVDGADLQFSPSGETLAAALSELSNTGCDTIVVLSHATPDESRALAQQFPEGIDYIVTAGGADEPPAEPMPIDNSQAQLIEVGHKGMYLAVLGFYDKGATPVRFQRVPLDARFEDSEEMSELLAEYQGTLELAGFGGLGLTPVTHPGGEFAGAESCRECHPKQYTIWRGSGHARATETLSHVSPPRLHDPECLSCHTTGWNPQDYYPYATGYLSLEQTPQLVGNVCDNCHGPAAQHVAVERDQPRDQLLLEQHRAPLRLTRSTVEQQTCIQCHDKDNSPDFDFDTYWPKIDHGPAATWDPAALEAAELPASRPSTQRH